MPQPREETLMFLKRGGRKEEKEERKGREGKGGLKETEGIN